MSELTLEALSWDDKQRVIALHPCVRIANETREYQYQLGQAKARLLLCGHKAVRFRGKGPRNELERREQQA